MSTLIGITKNIDDIPKHVFQQQFNIFFVAESLTQSHTDLQWLMRMNPNTYFVDPYTCFLQNAISSTADHGYKFPYKHITTTYKVIKQCMIVDTHILETMTPIDVDIVFVKTDWKDDMIKRNLLGVYAYLNRSYVITNNIKGPNYCFDPNGVCVYAKHDENPSLVTIHLTKKDMKISKFLGT